MAILAVAAVAALATGCGPKSHPNEPRPPIPAEVSVNVTDQSVVAQPTAVGVRSTNNAALNKNPKDTVKGDPSEPLIVNFTIINSTNTDTTIEVHGPGGFDKDSGPLVARGNTVFKLALPTGSYTLEAADLPGAKPAPFRVGSKRVSAQNDLLLP